MRDTIVITGAAGFIGSVIVRHLNDLGHGSNLVLVDNLDHPLKRRNLANKVYRSLMPVHALFPWLEGKQTEITAIIHMGACSNTLEQDVEFLKNNNTLYTQHLANYCLEHHIRFIYASSAATYGDGKQGFSDDHALLPSLQPLNHYGWSKHAFDLWALREGILDQIVGLKYFNIFGPNEAHKGNMSSMVYKMFPTAHQGKPIQLFKSTDPLHFSDGGQCRDFLYVKEAAALTCNFLNDKRGGIFNIGMGTPTTWNTLAHALFSALNLPTRIEYIDMPRELVPQYQNYTCAQMSKQATKLQYSIEETVADYVQHHLIPDTPW